MPWTQWPEGFEVRSAVPREGMPAGTHPTAGAALDRAGGLPATARDEPLLVVVNDPDRATDSPAALSAIRERVGARRVRLLVATGSHVHGAERRSRHEERLLLALRGPATVRWHAAGEDEQASCGAGRADPWLAAAQDVVGVGSVEPHWFAGLTGAHKTLSVGLLPRSAIEASHRLALSGDARPLRLEGNPVHASILATLSDLLEGRSAIAVQHLADGWLAGPPADCTAALLPAARERWGHALDVAVGFVVARVAPPLDRVLYQAEKGLKNSEDAVRDGGAVVLDAACLAGVGPARFIDLLARAPDEQAARGCIRRDGYVLGDHKAVRWRALQERGVAIAAVAPGFPADAARVAGLTILSDREHAVLWLRERLGAQATGVVVEDAAHTVVTAPGRVRRSAA